MTEFGKGMRIDHPTLHGFEFTGEFREPVMGDWFWSKGEQPMKSSASNWTGRRLILRKWRSTDLGDYELTGEWRLAKQGEPYLGWDNGCSRVREGSSPVESHILREKP